jgi:hypothetical protein
LDIPCWLLDIVLRDKLYIALDQAYVSQEVFSALYEMVGTTRGKIADFVKYVLDFEKKRKALKKSEKP